MEVIGGLVILVIGWVVFQLIFQAGVKTVGAVTRTAVGRGSLSENFNLAFQGMGPLEARFNDSKLGDDGHGPIVKQIEVRGMFPVPQACRIGFVTSVFDKTSGEFEPVISAIDTFQEPQSAVFQHLLEVGPVTPDQGFIGWVRVGAIFPETLETPFGGERQLIAILRAVDLENIPSITHGYHEPDHDGLLWQTALEFQFKVEGKGYMGAAEHRDEAAALCLQMAMAVAMADKSLADSEGEMLKAWISKSVAPFTPERQRKLKDIYNGVMRTSYALAKDGNLSLSKITDRMNEIGEKSTKYEAIELCFDVMVADGAAGAAELSMIRRLAGALDLNFDEIESMRDQKILALDTRLTNQASIEELLGIDPSWTKENARKHLRTEFQKWNNRLNALAEGEERNNAQRMLDLISEARKKYG